MMQIAMLIFITCTVAFPYLAMYSSYQIVVFSRVIMGLGEVKHFSVKGLTPSKDRLKDQLTRIKVAILLINSASRWDTKNLSAHGLMARTLAIREKKFLMVVLRIPRFLAKPLLLIVSDSLMIFNFSFKKILLRLI
jgi:hypothetical protein